MKILIEQATHESASMNIEQSNNSVIKTKQGFYIFAFPFIVSLPLCGLSVIDLLNRTIVEQAYVHEGEKFKEKWDIFGNIFNDEFAYAFTNEKTAYMILSFLVDFNNGIRREFSYYDYQLLSCEKSLKITKAFDEKTLALKSIDVTMVASTPITNVEIKSEINA